MDSRRRTFGWRAAVGVVAVLVITVNVVLLTSSWLGTTDPVPSQSASGSATPAGSAAPGDSASELATPQGSASVAPTLLAVGDIATCDASNDDLVGELAARLQGTIALLGDIAYQHGSSADFASCFDPTWGPLRDRLRPVPGNHEYETKQAAGYFAYFGAVAGQAGEGWYSYGAGAWHVVALNSECGAIGVCGAGSPELAWLVADLAAHPAECTLAYWHHPRWSSGPHGSSDLTEALWDTLAAAGADVVLSGHDHDYERFKPIDEIREFVVGTGGRSLYDWPGSPLPETEVRANDTYGLLELTLGEGEYSWRFIPAAGGSFTDSGAGQCR